MNSKMMDVAAIREWLENYLRHDCGINRYDLELPLFKQLDSFQVIGVLLACESEFGLHDQLGGDALTPLRFDQIVFFISERVSLRARKATGSLDNRPELGTPMKRG